MSLVEPSTVDGRTAVVVVRARSVPAALSWVAAGWANGVRLEVSSAAWAS